MKTLPHDQVSPLDRFTQYERGEQEDHKDHRCQDVSHRGIVTENVGDGESGWMFPVKILTGHGENSMNRRYESPPHHLFPTLSPVLRNPRKKTLNRRKQGLLGM